MLKVSQVSQAARWLHGRSLLVTCHYNLCRLILYTSSPFFAVGELTYISVVRSTRRRAYVYCHCTDRRAIRRQHCQPHRGPGAKQTDTGWQAGLVWRYSQGPHDW